jgi:hypothetical protein
MFFIYVLHIEVVDYVFQKGYEWWNELKTAVTLPKVPVKVPVTPPLSPHASATARGHHHPQCPNLPS